MRSDRKLAAALYTRGGPLPGVAVVKNFGVCIQRWMIGADRDLTFQLKAVAVAPGHVSVAEVDLSTIAIGDDQLGPRKDWKSRRGLQQDAIGRGRTGRWQVAISEGEQDEPRLGFIHTVWYEVLQGAPVKVDAGTNLGLGRDAVLPRLFRLEPEPCVGMEFGIYIDLRQKLVGLRASCRHEEQCRHRSCQPPGLSHVQLRLRSQSGCDRNGYATTAWLGRNGQRHLRPPGLLHGPSEANPGSSWGV